MKLFRRFTGGFITQKLLLFSLLVGIGLQSFTQAKLYSPHHAADAVAIDARMSLGVWLCNDAALLSARLTGDTWQPREAGTLWTVNRPYWRSFDRLARCVHTSIAIRRLHLSLVQLDVRLQI